MNAPMSSAFVPTAYRRARRIDVIVVGAGHSGLAMSCRLTSMSVPHVVLDAGDIGQRWRHERWQSLNLLTPNWMLDLPGFPYAGNDPDGYMHKDVLARHLADYAAWIKAPVKSFTRVHRIRKCETGYQVRTTQGDWFCRAVVIATGAYADPVVPQISAALPQDVRQLTMKDYKHPGDVADGRGAGCRRVGHRIAACSGVSCCRARGHAGGR